MVQDVVSHKDGAFGLDSYFPEWTQFANRPDQKLNSLAITDSFLQARD
jgi:hypothetical protein